MKNHIVCLLAALLAWSGIACAETASAKSPDKLCTWKGEKYSPGAIVRKEGADFRCSEARLKELDSPAVLAWVQLDPALTSLKP